MSCAASSSLGIAGSAAELGRELLGRVAVQRGERDELDRVARGGVARMALTDEACSEYSQPERLHRVRRPFLVERSRPILASPPAAAFAETRARRSVPG